jgi:hypothetical protein
VIFPLECSDWSKIFPILINAGTTISFSISGPQNVTLTVYDMNGREITVLLSQTLNPNTYSTTWGAKDRNGLEASSGIYCYELRSAGFVARKKMLLIR